MIINFNSPSDDGVVDFEYMLDDLYYVDIHFLVALIKCSICDY